MFSSPVTGDGEDLYHEWKVTFVSGHLHPETLKTPLVPKARH